MSNDPYSSNRPVVASKDVVPVAEVKPGQQDAVIRNAVDEEKPVENVPSNLGSVQQSQMNPTQLNTDKDTTDRDMVKGQLQQSGVNTTLRDDLGVVDEVGRQNIYESETKNNLAAVKAADGDVDKFVETKNEMDTEILPKSKEQELEEDDDELLKKAEEQKKKAEDEKH